MTPIPKTSPDPAVISAKSRQSFISAIPRPTSGSSRHATPTSGRPPTITAWRGAGSLQTDQKHRKSSWLSNDGAPPSSFHNTHSRLTEPEFLTPYQQRPQKDLSGIQQQLHIRSWSTKSLTEPDSLEVPPPPVHSPRFGGLIKSKTTNDLLSPREITPRRRLLQPIGPPLPRTQTLSNISCFGPTSLTPSPRKPSSVIASQTYGYHENTSQLSVGDALGESRMTEEEMEVLRQVQREAAINRIRLRNAHSLPPAASAPIPKGKTSAATTLMKNTAIPRPMGGIPRKSASGRLLFIDSALANKAAMERSSPSPRTLTGTFDSSSGSLPDNISKHVSSMLG